MKRSILFFVTALLCLVAAPLYADTLDSLVRAHLQGRIDARLWPMKSAVLFPTAEQARLVLETDAGYNQAVQQYVQTLGGQVELVEDGRIQAVLPERELDQLENLPGLRLVRFPLVAKPLNPANGDPEPTQGVAMTGAEGWHNMGITGKDTHVLVLDVEFNGYQSLLGVELPDAVEVDLSLGQGEGVHGAACAEVVHDMAPDARLTLMSLTTEIAFVSALKTITQDIQPDVVTASIGFSNYGPTDGTGWLAQKVNEAYEAGILYVGAAGNEATSFWTGPVRDDDGDGLIETLDSGEEYIGFSAADVVILILRWDEPQGEAAHDFALELQDSDGNVIEVADRTQNGDDNPTESIMIQLYGNLGSGRAVIRYNGLPPLPELNLRLYSETGLHTPWQVPEGTIANPADAPGCLTVGAVETGSMEVAYYSSHGPTQDGRQKPDIYAPTDVYTWSYWPIPFNGTSAATPHIAGAAALVMEYMPDADAQAVRNFLVTNVHQDFAGENDGAGYLSLPQGETVSESCEPQTEIGNLADLPFEVDDSTDAVSNQVQPAEGCDFEAQGRDRTYQLGLPEGAKVRITLTPEEGFDAALVIQKESCETDSPCLDAADDAGAGEVESLVFEAPGRALYQISVDSAYFADMPSASGEYTLRIELEGSWDEDDLGPGHEDDVDGDDNEDVQAPSGDENEGSGDEGCRQTTENAALWMVVFLALAMIPRRTWARSC